MPPYRASPEIVVMLPLQNAAGSIVPMEQDLKLEGTFIGKAEAYTPGFDNLGGSLTVSIYSVWRIYLLENLTAVYEQVPNAAVTMFPSAVTIDPITPLATFRLGSDIAWSFVNTSGGVQAIEEYRVFFSVLESATNASLVTDAGYPQGAYAIPGLAITSDVIQFSFTGDLDLENPLPISPRHTGSYRYHVALDVSPLDMGMGATGTIVYPFQISPPGAFRILVSDRTAPDNFTDVSSFVWTGAQRVIEFVLNTQDTPSGPARVNWTFTDPIFTPPRDLASFDLLPQLVQFDIVTNRMTVTVTNSNGNGALEDGITPGQPFWLLFQWTPPTVNGFVITLQANGMQFPGGSNSSENFTVVAQQTAYLAGPFIPLEPTTLGNAYDDILTIPINVALTNSSSINNQTDSTGFNFYTPVLVTVRRDRVYVINTLHTGLFTIPDPVKRHGVGPPGATKHVYELSAGGYESEPICVGVSLNSHFFSNRQQEIWVTPFSATLSFPEEFQDRAGLLFRALNNPAPAAGVSRANMPAGTVVLSRANNGTGCFVVAFDRNWPFLSSPLDSGAQAIRELINGVEGLEFLANTIGFWRVSAAIGGPNSALVFERSSKYETEDSSLLRMPNYFVVRQPSVRWELFGTGYSEFRYNLISGQAAILYVTLNEPAPRGLNYAVTCGVCILEQVDVESTGGSIGFPAGSARPHVWRVTFNVVPSGYSKMLTGGEKRLSIDPELLLLFNLNFWSYGADAAYYLAPPPIVIAVRPRSITVKGPSSSAFTVVGFPGGPYEAILNFPVVAGVTLVPIPYGDNSAMIFDPPTLEFTPGGPHTLLYTVTVNPALAKVPYGYWAWSWQLGGPDANTTVLVTDNSANFYLHVVPRPAPAIPSFNKPLIMGNTHGPFSVSLQVPILLGETGISVTPACEGATFIPSTLNFGPGQFQQTFSLRWDPPANGEAINNERKRVDWTVSGADEWKFAHKILTSSFEVEPRTFSMELDGAVVGVSYQGRFVLPMPTPGTLLLTPVAEGITFTPATTQFSAASGGFVSSGVVQEFTYVVSNDVLPGTVIDVFVRVGGADRSYYDLPEQPDSLVVSERGFILDSDQTLGDNRVFMVNRPSPMYTITLITGPLTDLSLTFESEYLEFFEGILIIPELYITPIAPIFTDGQSDDILVTLLDNGDTSSTLPSDVGDYNAFTLHIIASGYENVYIEPSVLEFSSANTGAVRKFTIRHTGTFQFSNINSYAISYYLKYGGNHFDQSHDITSFLPAHARQVTLKRYSIIPNFPKVLSYGWQQAAFNLTRSNEATLTLIPHMPLLDGASMSDGQYSKTSFGGDAVAGGRIQFDPPVVVFTPGQMVSQFKVKANPGLTGGADSVYFRIEWEINGHPEDVSNYLEYVAPRKTSGINSHFPTFHVASAALLRLSAAFVFAFAMIALAL